MKVLRALLFAVLGLVAGYVITATLAILLLPATPADNGGLEMFVFFGLAPIGGVIGAIAGLLFGLLRKRPPAG
ncbi:MAG: hypothetical protein KDE32_09120 [Novosphingobium sp.]|nr:hypothetical protein [Novosphingobium sp.]